MRSILNYLLHLRQLPKGRVIVGKHSVGTPHVYMFSKDTTVTIGDYCSIGPDVIIIPEMGHIPLPEFMERRVSTFPLTKLNKNAFKAKYLLPTKESYVNIGNDVWIGARAIILPAVTVCDGAIIGAGAVVTHDVPPYSIVGGVPAEIIKYRYNYEQVQKLLRISWWKWTENKIRDNMDYFYGSVDDFIKKFDSKAESTT